MDLLRRLSGSRKGNVSVVAALTLPVIAAMAGAAVELARVNELSGQLQDAVDAGVIHAAKVASSGGKTAAVQEAARMMVLTEMQGDLSAQDITVDTVVTSTSPMRLSVRASTTLPLVFGRVLGQPTSDVQRAAVAQSELVPVCVLLLDPSATAWSAGGGSRVVGTGCVAHVNSTSTSALQSNGGAGATMRAILTAGSVAGANGFNPKPTPQQPALTDPIGRRLTWPAAPAACTAANTDVEIDSAKSLSPGNYCGGISVSNKGVATLSPGVYVIRDGDLSVKSGTLQAPSGVTIVLLGSTSVVSVLSGGTLSVSAPTTGPWHGIAIAQKPQPTELTSKMQGGGSLVFDGIVYLPTQACT
jgi:Flp pilus assembly protein TadG